MYVKEQWPIPKKVCTRGRLRPSEKNGCFESFEKETAYAKEEFLLRPSSESERHSFYHKEDVLVRRRKARCKTVVGGLERK